MSPRSTEVCVIGAGPAGASFAARMAQLGHRVTLIERAAFPRGHLGESLSPGVLPLLEITGARAAIEAANFRRVSGVHVRWGNPLQIRPGGRTAGVLVDRGEFDRLLLQRARDLGVRVLQPAHVRHVRCDEHGWSLEVQTDVAVRLRADFLATATGRSARLSADKHRTGCRTLALYAYWRGRAPPQVPSIEAGRDAWYWGVPLPDGTFNTLIFVDARRARGRGSLRDRFLELLGQSALAAPCREAELQGTVRAQDATAYLDGACVTRSSIKIGDAALAIDPISSSGVQKAIQSALAAATTAHTVLLRPTMGDTAMRFYRDNLADASSRHARWAAEHYHAAAERLGGCFWQARAVAPAAGVPAPEPPAAEPDVHQMAGLPLELSRQVEFVDLPCIEGDFVTVKSALRHPNLEGPVAYLGGRELAPLLRDARAGATALQLAQSWSAQLEPAAGLAVAAWLIRRGILVGREGCGRGHGNNPGLFAQMHPAQ